MAKKAKKVANTIEDPREKVPCGGYVRFLYEAGCEFPTNIVVEKYTPGSICKKCPGWWNFCPGFKENVHVKTLI